MRAIERLLMLRTIDSLWVEHLTAMDEMRQGIGLRAYGQTDPLVAYKREAHDMWSQLLEAIRHRVTRQVYHTVITQRPPQEPPPRTTECAARRPRLQATARRWRKAVAAAAAPQRQHGRARPRWPP